MRFFLKLAISMMLAAYCQASFQKMACASKPVEVGVAVPDVGGPLPAIGARIHLKNLDELKTLPTRDFWCVLPEWAAGTWQVVESKVEGRPVDQYIFQMKFSCNGEKEARFPKEIEIEGGRVLQLGMLRDRSGIAWHHIHEPRTLSSTDEFGHSIELVVAEEELSQIGGERVGHGSLVIRLYKDKSTGKNLFVVQRHSVDSYTQQPDGTMVVKSHCDTFDENGQIWDRGADLTFRLKQIKKLPSDGALDAKELRESFRKYLQGHGMADLVP